MNSFLLFCVLAANSGPCSMKQWDDSHATALQGIELQGKDGRRLAVELARMIASWKDLPSYKDLRDRAGKLGTSPTSQLRIEMGTPGAATYRALWVIVTGDSAHGLRVDGDLTDCEIPFRKWQELESWIKTHHAWQLASDADVAMDDGTAYLVSLCHPDGVGQFVLYSPVLGTLTQGEERRSFARRTRIQNELLGRVLKLFGGA